MIRGLITFGIVSILTVSVLAIWQLWPAEGHIESEEAREIALDHVKSSLHKEEIDTARVSIRFQVDIQAYVVDFALKGAIEMQPRLWTEGYFVVVDANSGDVKEAHLYER